MRRAVLLLGLIAGLLLATAFSVHADPDFDRPDLPDRPDRPDFDGPDFATMVDSDRPTAQGMRTYKHHTGGQDPAVPVDVDDSRWVEKHESASKDKQQKQQQKDQHQQQAGGAAVTKQTTVEAGQGQDSENPMKKITRTVAVKQHKPRLEKLQKKTSPTAGHKPTTATMQHQTQQQHRPQAVYVENKNKLSQQHQQQGSHTPQVARQEFVQPQQPQMPQQPQQQPGKPQTLNPGNPFPLTGQPQQQDKPMADTSKPIATDPKQPQDKTQQPGGVGQTDPHLVLLPGMRRVAEDLYVSSAPTTREQLLQLKQAGFEFLVNVNDEDELPGSKQKLGEVANEVGLKYLELDAGDDADDWKDASKIMKVDYLMRPLAGKRTVIFGESLSHVGGFFAMYAAQVEGAPIDQALILGREYGLERKYEEKIRKFLTQQEQQKQKQQGQQQQPDQQQGKPEEGQKGPKMEAGKPAEAPKPVPGQSGTPPQQLQHQHKPGRVGHQ